MKEFIRMREAGMSIPQIAGELGMTINQASSVNRRLRQCGLITPRYEVGKVDLETLRKLRAERKTIDELAEYFDVGTSTIKRHIQAHLIPKGRL